MEEEGNEEVLCVVDMVFFSLGFEGGLQIMHNIEDSCWI